MVAKELNEIFMFRGGFAKNHKSCKTQLTTSKEFLISLITHTLSYILLVYIIISGASFAPKSINADHSKT